jgi:FkbM family methyltransferase
MRSNLGQIARIGSAVSRRGGYVPNLNPLPDIARRAMSFGRKRVDQRRLRLDYDAEMGTERLGSGYGGWSIVPGLVRASSVVYCFGVGEDISFDSALIERFGVHVHGFDPTPRAIRWAQSKAPEGFSMHPVGLADFDGEAAFQPPSRAGDVSHSMVAFGSGDAPRFTVRRLETIMWDLGHQHVDLLKMDIEGAEYAVIEDLGRGSVRPTQLLIEFHHRFPQIGVRRTQEAVADLKSMGYALVAVSESKEELSFALT